MATLLYLFWALTWMAWVGLALYPSAMSSPEWVQAAREICFGSLPEGLPSSSGWLMLLAPVPMLVVLIAMCGPELRTQWRRLGFAACALLLMLPVLTVGYAAKRVLEERLWSPAAVAALPSLSEDYPRLAIPCPEFRLKDQNGLDFQVANLKGDVTVMTFAYAHCQTVCPRLLETMRGFQGARKVVVTLDPWRDTCGSLAGLADLWRLGEASVLSGDPEQVAVLTSAFGVPVERDLKTGEITHPALVFVLDREARVVYAFQNPSLDWLSTAVGRLRKE